MRAGSDRAPQPGFGYAAVKPQIKPDIVYVRATGSGRPARIAPKPAYDDAIQAAPGLASLFAQRRRHPQYVPAAMADKSSSE